MSHVIVLVGVDGKCHVTHIVGVIHLPKITPLIPRILHHIPVFIGSIRSPGSAAECRTPAYFFIINLGDEVITLLYPRAPVRCSVSSRSKENRITVTDEFTVACIFEHSDISVVGAPDCSYILIDSLDGHGERVKIDSDPGKRC